MSTSKSPKALVYYHDGFARFSEDQLNRLKAHPNVGVIFGYYKNGFQQEVLPPEIRDRTDLTHLVLFLTWQEYEDGKKFVAKRGLELIEMSQFLDRSVTIEQLFERLDQLAGAE